jgi:hypothetical protein
MTALGFDTGNWSVDYVAGWAGGSSEAMTKTAERVVSTAHETLDRLAPELSSSVAISGRDSPERVQSIA